MIWRSSQKIGIGEAGRAVGKYYLVVSHFPPGNIYGQYKNNIQTFSKYNPTLKQGTVL